MHSAVLAASTFRGDDFTAVAVLERVEVELLYGSVIDILGHNIVTAALESLSASHLKASLLLEVRSR